MPGSVRKEDFVGYLATVLLATEAAESEPSGSVLTLVLPLLVLGGLFYFMIVMPQRRRVKAADAMRNSVDVGDEVRTIGGMYGRVIAIDDQRRHPRHRQRHQGQIRQEGDRRPRRRRHRVNRRRLWASIVVITAIAWGSAIYAVVTGWGPTLGLDLRGGFSVTLVAPDGTDAAVLDKAVEIMRQRIENLGSVQEPEISVQGNRSILVQLPGVEDRDRALDAVGTTGTLSFRPVLEVGVVSPAFTNGTLPLPEELQGTTTTTVPEGTSTTLGDGSTTTTGPDETSTTTTTVCSGHP